MKFFSVNTGKKDGFTLIELLVVVLILGLLAAFVGPKMFGQLGKAEHQSAKTQIESLGTALDVFRLDMGRYPTTSEGLNALRQRVGSGERWRGPYLKKSIPKDPWGEDYIYRCPGQHGDYDLFSYGADRVQGGEGDNADVVSWE
ncbi:MAG: type II secretion system major pseudopilin GspG [Thermodesulfobacteriota bacterium]|nr:type II secretion system major pseudopilin GspG [Thermodesulfobacteriota bacterium]